MSDERSSLQQRVLVKMFRPRLERTYPASNWDAAGQEMLAILEKADRRNVIAATEPSGKT